ncbi:MAG: M28 family peptidase [Thermoanaerobaculia bacterium]
MPSREEMLAWIRGFETGPTRLAGTAGGLRAEELVEGRFRELGLEGVAREPIRFEVWEPGEAALECGGRSFPCYPVARARFTGPEGVAGPLVFIGEGDPASLDGRSLEGKIAVLEVRFAPRPYQLLRKTAHAVHDPGGSLEREPETRASWILPGFARAYSFCVARGAAGLVCILRDLRANRHRYHYPYAHPDEILPLPAVFVGRDSGTRLRKLLASGESTARIATTGRTGPGATHNLLGFLPGSSDELVLVTSHHDSPFGGHVDDASGLAALLAVASRFARKSPAERPLSLAFLAAAGNFQSNMGARAFLARHAHDLVPRLVLALTVEHVALEAEERHGKLRPTGHVEPRGIFVSDRPELLDLTTLAVIGNDLRRSTIVPVAGEEPRVDGEARAYFAAGLPTIGIISGPEYVLTDDGGPEWIAADELVPVAKTAIEILEAFMQL